MTDSSVADRDMPDADNDAAVAGPSGTSALTKVLVIVLVVGLMGITGAVGYLMHSSSSSSSASPGVASVDAGFARDMSTHHEQAIEMATYTQNHSNDPAIKLLAYDIATSQNFQVGQMSAWLQAWGLARTSDLPAMSWMGGHAMLLPDGRMPGMASVAEMDKLQTLSGKQLDVMFLQLMLRHHTGGVQMAQHAAENAKTPYLRDLAAKMAAGQSAEIVDMERMLRERGAAPLPFP